MTSGAIPAANAAGADTLDPQARPHAHGQVARVPSLDGFRAVAILCVLLTHATTTYHFPAQALLRKPFGVFGLLGVEVFFVLSGFLIASILLREIDLAGRFSLKHFWARRALRILPVFLCLVLVLIVLRVVGYIYIRSRGWIELATFTVNFRYHPRWSVGHLWFLALEVHFYVMFPLVVRYFRPRTVVRVLLGTLVFCFAARWLSLLFFRHDPVFMEMIEYMTFTRLDSLATGCLLAYAVHDPGWLRRVDAVATRGAVVAVSVLAVVVILVVCARVWWFLPAAGNTALALLLPVIVWAAVRRPEAPAARFLNTRAFVALGLASYSVYIWQQLFLFQDRPGFVHNFPQNVFFTLIAAAVSYAVIERPFLKLKRRYSDVPTEALTTWDAASVTPSAATSPPSTPFPVSTAG
jgi:peptidoglycan/LPS O-acetylase OafA/YrhL